MAKLTYQNKETLYENPNIPDKNKVKADDMNSIKKVVNTNENKILLAISDTAPSTCATGDLYYNTTSKKIFEATGTNTWGSTGTNPTSNTIYILFDTKTTYSYDGTDLVSVGGGGDEVAVQTTEPTGEDSDSVKIWINPNEAPSGSLNPISNTYGVAQDKGYSQEYLNGKLENRIIEKGRLYLNEFTSYAMGSNTYAYKTITFTGTYTNPPLVITQCNSTTNKTLYGDIPSYVRSITNTGADIIIAINISNNDTWVDYIVISMD